MKRKIVERQKLQLLEQARNYKKISYEQLEKDAFGVQEYFSTLTVSQARLWLKVVGGMCPRVASLFPSDRKFIKIDFECGACRVAGRPASEAHDTTECPFYEHFKSDVSLETDIGLVTFMKRVLDNRAENEEMLSTV